MPPQFDFNTGPEKIFVDATNTAFGKGVLLMRFRSGDQNRVFMFEIGHAKQLARILSQNIEAYEQQFGPVDGRLPTEPVPSPFQSAKGSGDSGDKK